MAKPRIFVSSTYYDLRHVRASIETFICSLGYDPVLSEKGSIAYIPDIPIDESCYREAAGSDILVLIIGGRYGSERSDSRTSLPRTFFERYDSITKEEYQSALRNNVPIYILIDVQVYAEYQTFLRNKTNDGIEYAHVDSVNVFSLIDDILTLRQNNAFTTFSKYTEIEDWLREQWAGYFRELLKRTTESRQIASLSSQVLELAEINKTLRTYLENLMRTVSPEQSESVIEEESNRLGDLERRLMFENYFVLHGNNFLKLLTDLRGETSHEEAREWIESATDKEDFIRKLNDNVSSRFAHRIEDMLRAYKDAQREINDARVILGKEPFKFDEDEKGTVRHRLVSVTRGRPPRRGDGAKNVS
jgi:hypothetical protein